MSARRMHGESGKAEIRRRKSGRREAEAAKRRISVCVYIHIYIYIYVMTNTTNIIVIEYYESADRRSGRDNQPKARSRKMLRMFISTLTKDNGSACEL